MGGGGEGAVSSSLPLPSPKTYSQYTDENIRRGLAPPPPPVPATQDTYTMFGNTLCMDDPIIQPLESQVRRCVLGRWAGKVVTCELGLQFLDICTFKISMALCCYHW